MFTVADYCQCAQVLDEALPPPYALAQQTGSLWVGLCSSGQCLLEGGDEALPLRAGSLFAARSARLVPIEAGHLLAARLTGTAAADFATQLSQPLLTDALACPDAPEWLGLLNVPELDEPRRCSLAFALICRLSAAPSAEHSFPPLVSQALSLIQENYAGLYGVEELSATLGVSKSHLVRCFSRAVGVPPGQYLAQVRLDAAKLLLAHREYPLEVVASLCGFSGANYLCRVFRKATGQTPAQYRSRLLDTQQPTAPLPQEKELYI